MLIFLFGFALIFSVISFFTGDAKEDGFNQSYRMVLDRFWHIATGTPAYRKCF